MILIRAIFFTLLISVAAQATSRAHLAYQVGVLVCPDHLESLDLYEGRVLRGLQYDPQQTIDRALENFRPRMWDRAELYQNLKQQFETRKQMVSEAEIGNFDSQDLVIQNPAGCRIAVLISDHFSGRLQVQASLWNALSPMDQTAALLNWMIAAELYQATGSLPSNSIYIRNLASLLPTDRIRTLKLTELIQVLQGAGLQTFRQQGILVDVSKAYQIVNELFKRVFPVSGSTWTYQPPDGVVGRVQTVKLRKDEVVFHDDGTIRSLRFEGKLFLSTVGGEIPMETPEQLAMRGFEQDIYPRVYFSDSGILDSGAVLASALFQTPVLKLQLAQGHYGDELMNNSKIYFDDDGSINTLTKVSGSIFFNGQWLRIAKSSSVVFWDGKFHEFETLDAFTYPVQGQSLSWRGPVSFDASGHLDFAYLDQAAVLKKKDGKLVRYRRGEPVYFDDAGWVR